MMEQQYPPFDHLFPCGVRRPSVRARLVHNFDIFNYIHDGTQKQIWKMIFVDNQDDGMQCTIFSPHVDVLIGRFRIGFIYVLHYVQIVPADNRNDIVSSSKQMLLTSEKNVIREEDDDVTIPTFYYDIVPLSQIECHVNRCDLLIDVIGLVLYVSPIEPTRNNNSTKREVVIMDKTWTVSKLTVWNDYVHAFDNVSFNNDECAIVVACGLHVRNYNGAYLTTGYYSRVYLNPENKHSASLSTWYGSKRLAWKRVTAGRASPMKLHSTIAVYNSIRTKVSRIPQIKNVQYCRLVAETRCFHTPANRIIYEACNHCLRKVVTFERGHKCQQCNLKNVITIPRLLLQLIIFEYTGELRVTLMNDLAQLMLQKTAIEIKSELQQPDGCDKVFNILMMAFGFRAYSWILHPPIGDFNQNKFYTVDYIFGVDWEYECSSLFKRID